MKLFAESFLIIYAIFRGVETFCPRSKIDGAIVARHTLSLIVIAYVCFYLVVLWDVFHNDDTQFPSLTLLAGATLVIASTIGRTWSIKTLSNYHSIHIEIRTQHNLVQSGPYRFVRNPYYLSNIVECIGLILIATSVRALLNAAFVYLPLLIYRIVVEEFALKRKFGTEFSEYRASVPLLIPRFFRKNTAGYSLPDGKVEALRSRD